MSFPKKVIGLPTIFVEQGPGLVSKVTLADGTVVTTGKAATHPLAYALNAARPGDVIQCKGELEGFHLGKYDPSKGPAVYWPNGDIVRDISIIGDPTVGAKISDCTFMGNTNVPGQHGCDDFTFSNVTLRNKAVTATPVIIAKGHQIGLLRFYDVHFTHHPNTGWGGYGTKWGLRGHGRARYDVRHVTFDGCQEHAFYIDSPGADGSGDSVFKDFKQLAPSGRTGIQIVNRANEGASGKGNLWFHALTLWTKKGDGGSGFTCVGHLGDVNIDGLVYTGNLGAIVFWSNANDGLHTTPDGYATQALNLSNVYIDSPGADRAHIMISGVKTVNITDFLITGNKIAFDFNSKYGGSIKNGTVNFTLSRGNHHSVLSQYPGFKSTYKIYKDQVKLTDNQIDTLWPNV